MPKLYVKASGVWKQVQRLWVKKSGAWAAVNAGLINQAGIGKQFYPDTIGPTVYSTSGSYTYIVPATVTSISVAAAGGGGAGQVSVFNGGSWAQSTGASGGNTTVTNGTWTITSNGGGGGVSSGVGGTVSISGATSTTLNQTGGAKSGGTGGSSYYGSGSSQGGDFSKPTTPSSGAGGGGGYSFDGPLNYGGSAGGTGIAVFAVTPGQTITITVGAGAIGANADYTKGSSHGSYAGNGGSGYVSITPLNANIVTYSTGGTYTFTVPAGVTSISASQVVGAGGGGGGNNSSGNIVGGTGGGSGGYYTNQTLAVTPGEALTITVGSGGYGGNWRFNDGSYNYNTEFPNAVNKNPGTYNGGPGDTTSIKRGSTVLLQATGGGGGGANQSTPGSAGSPNGVAGGGTYDTGNCTIPINKGVNALGLGSGGNGGQCYVGSTGSDGIVTISY